MIMPWHAIYEETSGRLVSTGTVVAPDSDLAAGGLVRKTLAFDPQVETKQWNEGTKDFDDVPAPLRQISTKKFFARFTSAERENIFQEARTNKRLHGFIESLRLMEIVEVADSYVISSVNAMEAAGLIGNGRAAEVLIDGD